MKRINIILLSILLIACCVLAMTACDSTPDFASFDEGFCTRWMGEIADGVSLSALSIPGTHDSGAYKSGIVANLGKDQQYDISDQLDMGARFLDIRLVLKNEKLGVFHGIINEKLSFDGVLNIVRAFLAEHPTECVLMSIKKEDGDSITQAVHDAIEAEPELWYTREAIPTLGEVRGKIVLFRRFEDEGEFGVDLYSYFPDNTAFSVDGKVKCYVQDYYNVGTKNNLKSKWDKVTETLTYANIGPKDEYVINFTSAYYDKKIVGKTVPAIKETAEYIHEKLGDYVFEHKRYGIVLYDYIQYDLAAGLVYSNFAAQSTGALVPIAA